MTYNKKQTSKSIASFGAKIMNNKTASKTAKTLAASAVSQSSTSKQTSGKVETLASKVLNSTKYSKETKKLAGSVLSQANKERKS